MQAHVAGLVQAQLQQVDSWQQQNKGDQWEDMQQLEALMLQAVGGLEELQEQLANQEVPLEGLLEGQAVGLQQVADWMMEMRASSSIISSHLQDEEVGTYYGLGDISVELGLVFQLMESNSGKRIVQLPARAPVQLIPRGRILVPDGALTKGSNGACSRSRVVCAMRDGGAVAVKVCNITHLGQEDQRAAVREALLLSRVWHGNVVKCLGLVHDPDSAHGHSLHGSLVMEWVGGGSVNEFLRENHGPGLGVRVHIAFQVAAGMQHLHEHKMVHGDVKPQNILLQFYQGKALPMVRGPMALWCLLASGRVGM
jgi:hypothetical protein